MNWTKIDKADASTFPPEGETVVFWSINTKRPVASEYTSGAWAWTMGLYSHWTRVLSPAAEPTPDLAGEVDRPICGKTADGVEVRMGDAVWFRHHRKGEQPQKWYASLGGNAVSDNGWSSMLDVSFYSTAEAAQAACAQRDAALAPTAQEKP